MIKFGVFHSSILKMHNHGNPLFLEFSGIIPPIVLGLKTKNPSFFHGVFLGGLLRKGFFCLARHFGIHGGHF